MRFFKNEKDFTRWVLAEARKRGWRATHLGNMQVVRRPDGSTQAVPLKDARGFPDVVAVHSEHGVIYAELKMPGGKPDNDQLDWLWSLRESGQLVYVWYPHDQNEIADVLDGRLMAGRLFDHEGKAATG